MSTTPFRRKAGNRIAPGDHLPDDEGGHPKFADGERDAAMQRAEKRQEEIGYVEGVIQDAEEDASSEREP